MFTLPSNGDANPTRDIVQDVLRGFALLGIIVVNVAYTGVPEEMGLSLERDVGQLRDDNRLEVKVGPTGTTST